MCPDKELLSAYADGEVPAPWDERIRSHAETCADCAREIASLETLSSRMAGVQAPDFSSRADAAFARLTARETFERSPFLGSPLRVPVPLAVAAVALVAFMLGLLVTRRDPGQGLASRTVAPMPQFSAQYDDSRTGDDVRALVEMLQGKNVEIRIQVDFPGSDGLRLSGEPEMIATGAPPQGASR